MTGAATQAYGSRSTYVCVANPSWQVDFVALGARVRTTLLDDPDEKSFKRSRKKSKHLLFEIESEIDLDLDAASEAARYSRPRLLALQGVITFLTGEPLTVYDAHTGSHTKLQTQPTRHAVNVVTCRIADEDHATNLTKLLTILHRGDNKSIVLASALDRWRRALYLSERSSEEDTPLVDEVYLGFFHVLELLADEEFSAAGHTLRGRIQAFCTELYADEMKQTGKGLTNLVAKRAEVFETLVADDISVSVKIARLISKHEAYSPRLRAFVAKLVEVRNSLAHGRYVYQPKVQWPLPAFFPLHEETSYMTPALRVFAAHIIDLQCQTGVWDERWLRTQTDLDPAAEEVFSYIGSGEVDRDPADALLGKHPHGITTLAMVNLYLTGKLNMKMLEKGARRLLLSVRVSERNAPLLFPLAVLIADSEDAPLASRCRRIVQRIIAQRWTGYSSPKDFLREVEHHGKKAAWYRTMLTS